jgi:putative flavoprotein involved in K+ transport
VVVERIETLIVGGGQAGLALSHHLRGLGREHVILERARVAERWRSERWDSLTFQFPSWSIRLPGQDYRGGDPEGFAPRDEVVRFLDEYRTRIAAPVREGVTVRSVAQKPGAARFLVETDAGAYEAADVVAATGPYQAPALPPTAATLPPDIVQVHSSRYRSPAMLPPGAVLVVGSGASGCQILEDLLDAGRTVFLSVGRHRRVPRRYRGRDVFWWIDRIGALDQTIEERPDARSIPNPLVTGACGGHDIDLRDYARQGVILLGHLREARDGRLFLDDDVASQIARGDEGMGAFARAADEWALREGLGPPRDDERVDRIPPGRLPASPGSLDLRAAGITAVIWATGFRPDFGWIRLPVLDAAGDAVHRLGLTACPGFYFLGLPWLSKLKSSVLCGVGEDAERIAAAIAAGSSPRARA